MRMGEDGVAIVKPDQNGGLPVDNGEQTNVESPASGSVPTTPEPDQTDFDVFDPITEVKND